VILKLKELFQKQTRGERYLIYKTSFFCKMIKYNLVKEYVLIFYEYMRRLKTLGVPITQTFGELIL
jgi:CRISPR/Cas system endoribonuclease Cas6 (RAMP superfamily)